MHLILFWALVAIIGRVYCKCSLIPIVDDERSIAYACTHGSLNDLEEITSEAEWIEFTVSQLHHIPDNAFWKFNNLRRLSFYNCHVKFIDPGAFAGLDRLEWLIFHGVKLHVARTAWFRPLVNLRKLILDNCGLVHIEPDVFRQLPNIETLGLKDNDLDCLPIKELSYLRNIRTVRIEGNPWLCECRQRLDEYLKGRSIVQKVPYSTETENVCQCMTPIGFPELSFSLAAQRSNNFNKDRTTIRANELRTNVLTSLDKFPDKTTWIEISGLTIDKLPRYAFFRFGNSLRSLDLNDCGIAAIEDDAFGGLHRLQRLSMVGNRFSTVGANWFRDLVDLRHLILERNDIKRFETNSLSRVGDSLRHLDIRNNRLSCITVEDLNELKKLERLDAVGNPILCSCRDDLQHFLSQRIVGFEINVGRCYNNENEIPDVTGGRAVQQITINETTITTGEIHWISFEDTIEQSNVTLAKPTIYTAGCRPEETDGSSYACRAVTSIEELSVIPSTAHTIRVIQSNIKRIPKNCFSRFDDYLSRLELRDCNIENIEPRAFSNLSELKHLSLHDNKLESIGAETFQGLYNLKYLDLSRNNVHGIASNAFDRSRHLATLDISENAIKCIDIERMVHGLCDLSYLRISNNPWDCMCVVKIIEFLNGRGIRYDDRSLVLKEDCYVTQIPAKTTEPPATTQPGSIGSTGNETIEGNCVAREDTIGLRYVCTGGNLLLLQSIPPEVAAIVFQNGYLPRLPTAVFSRFTNLRELVIRNCGLTIVEQGAFQHGVSKLQNLTIQDNPLEMIGSSWFVMETLERLDLRGNSINYIEPGAFRRLSRLSYLNLEGNDLRCIFTSDLNDMPNVYIVEFFGNPLKWRCRVELEQFLEARKIRFVKIENSCEGLKLVRSLLLQNKTDGSFDCPSDCSIATNIGQYFLPLLALPFLVTLVR